MKNILIACVIIVITFSLNAQELYYRVNKRGFVSRYSIDFDSTGNFIAVWDDYRYCSGYSSIIGTEYGPAIFLQKFNINGENIGNNIRIDTKKRFKLSNTRPEISINKENGDIAIAWQERSESSSRIIGSIFNSNLKKIAYQFTIADNESIWQAYPKIKYLSNGNILISWYETYDNERYYMAKIYSDVGLLVTDTFRVNQDDVKIINVNFDVLSDGFYFVWSKYMQFYNNEGNPTSNIIEEPYENVSDTKRVDENTILIITRDDSTNQNIWGIIYNINQNIFSDRFKIDDDTTTYCRHGSVKIGVNENKEIIVVWSDNRNGNGNDITDIYAQRYDKDNIPIGNNFKINHEDTERSQRHPKVFLIDDQIILTYLQSEQVKENDSLPPGMVAPSTSRTFIAGTSQNFYAPIPGRIFGWEYLFDLVYTVGYPYPNPFIKTLGNCSVEIEFDKETLVSYKIYNILGKKVFKCSPDLLLEGEYNLTWDGNTDSGEIAPSGVYIWVIHLENNIITRKSTFIK